MAGDSTEKSGRSGAQLDVTGEFFTVGAPLHAVRAGYVRRKADDLLYDTVVAGQFAHVLAPEHTGKTSLIAATAARLENNGCKVAILDLAQIGVRDGGSDPGRWYYNVAYRLLRQLRIRYDLQSWWQDKSVLSNRQRLVEFYSEIILQFVPERVVVFIDEIQCIERLSYASELLVSIRAAHNARTTDPDFSRLTFVLMGECDCMGLIAEAELSPFNVSQQVSLGDFSRADLEIFSTELNLAGDDAAAALDRVYHWTRGQPYLSQKIARSIARDVTDGDVAAHVDLVATRQIAGRAALHSEPHMSHIHRAIVDDTKRKEPLLNLYGKIRKGVEVSADLGSPLQRRLIALGLIEIDEDGNLRVRNRLYEAVFTARWANENLPIRLRVPAIVIGVLLLLAMIPFAYTQWLPRPYMNVLTAPDVELETATTAYENLRSFPGHSDTADTLFREFLERRAQAASDEGTITAIASLAGELPDAGRLAESLQAGFWDRRALSAMREERRDEALLATLQSLVLSTPKRRQRAANLVGDDYPELLASLAGPLGMVSVFDPVSMILSSADGANIKQWSYAQKSLNRRDDWTVTALEVSPLVRRVIVDRAGTVSRIGLTLGISHARLSDLRIKLIAPSGRTVELEAGIERASSSDEISVPAAQLRPLIGESLAGTWSLSVRDENPGIAGQFVGWNLKLNSQGAVEEFQRGLNIPEPVERETDNVWFDTGGRYAVARAMQSDSARIWDLAFAEPLRAIAVNENETLIGLDAGARRLMTATQDSVNLWDTTTGAKIASIPVGAASGSAVLTVDGTHLFVERRSDVETRLELWSLDERAISAELVVAGAPSLVAIDATGARVAVADYDRAVRIWDLASGELIAQVDLSAQPSAIDLATSGDTLGVIYGGLGLSLWNVDSPKQALLETSGSGRWQLRFSPSGRSVVAGNPDTGFQVYATADGRLVGPPVGVRSNSASPDVLLFGDGEQILVTGASDDVLRFWKAPMLSVENPVAVAGEHQVWSPSGGRVAVALPGAARIAVGDPSGHVHLVAAGASREDLQAINDDVSFVGHNSAVRGLVAAGNGTAVASAGADNTVRVWSADNGQPMPYVLDVAGSPVLRMAFSADATLLAVLNNDSLQLVNVANGGSIVAFDLDEQHNAIAFAGNSRLFIGAESGALRSVDIGDGGAWVLRQVWQGAAPLRMLAASPRGHFLVLVDADNHASQFVLSEGQMSTGMLQLPGPVRDVTFTGDGRVLMRTARWVHRISSSSAGLMWLDAAFVPNGLPGRQIVHGSRDPSDPAAHRAYLPVVRNAFVEFVELGFRAPSSPGLFGNKDELLAEWQTKLRGHSAQGTAQGSDE